MRRCMQLFASSVSAYAVTAVYTFGVFAMVLISTGDLRLIFGIIAFGLATVLVGMVALYREALQVHQLIATLQENGVSVPKAADSERGIQDG